MRKVLFLDIDGVMFLGVSKGDGLYASDRFDEKCVDALNKILTETGCEMVITSTWQNDFDIEQLQKIFAANGIKYPPAAVSSTVDGGFVVSTERADDILKWLSVNNPANLMTWCAVDDSDLASYLQNFVKCDPKIGLKDPRVVSNVISMLNQ